MRKKFILLAALFLGVGACGSEEPPQDEFDRMIDQEVKNRLNRWADAKRRNCEQALLEEATILVDSIILEQAREAAAQKEKPPKPVKPAHPEPLELPDSLPLKPIFESGDSSQELSLGGWRLQSSEMTNLGVGSDLTKGPFRNRMIPGPTNSPHLTIKKSRHAIN
jgi:hypothetical protein